MKLSGVEWRSIDAIYLSTVIEALPSSPSNILVFVVLSLCSVFFFTYMKTIVKSQQMEKFKNVDYLA